MNSHFLLSGHGGLWADTRYIYSRRGGPFGHITVEVDVPECLGVNKGVFHIVRFIIAKVPVKDSGIGACAQYSPKYSSRWSFI